MQSRVKELMKQSPVTIPADSTLMEAAEEMKSIDCGVLPVGEPERLEGIITDRDIVLRAVAEGKNTSTEKVRDYMTPQLYYCNEDDLLEQAAMEMRRHNVNRLLVKDSSGRMTGIITFGCLLRKSTDLEEVEKVVESAVGRKAA